VDPDLLNLDPDTDPDPAFQVKPDTDRDQSGSRVLVTKNWKNTTEISSPYLFDIKNAIFLSLGLHKGRPSYRRSLQLSIENIQHLKIKFINFFLFLFFFG
jgi:hypothetical protein